MRVNVDNKLWNKRGNVKRKMMNNLWRVVGGVRLRSRLSSANRNFLRSMGFEVLV